MATRYAVCLPAFQAGFALAMAILYITKDALAMVDQKATKTRKETTFGTRMNEETKRKMGEVAAAENRTVTNWLEFIVEREHAKLRRRKSAE